MVDYRVYAQGRTVRGAMNSTETKYAEHLQMMTCARGPDRVSEYHYESMTLILSHPDRTTDKTDKKDGRQLRYTADFLVVTGDGAIYLDDVKGSINVITAGARKTIQWAAVKFPCFRFRIVTPMPRGGWHFEEIR